MNERYIFFKKLFPNYIIIFKNNNKYIFSGIDKKIIDLFGLKYVIKNCNYIIVDVLIITKKIVCTNNKYELLLSKTIMIDFLNSVFKV